MSNLEHYFENLLFYGKDVPGECNKNSLTIEQQKAVEVCTDYVIWTLFLNREEFLKFADGENKMEIVRCKDCKHRPVRDGVDIFKPDTFDSICPYLCDDDSYYNKMPEDNWFCNFGEKGT